MAKRNSQLTELLIVAQDDYLTIVDTSAGQSKRISVKNLTGAPDLGWTATGEAWSFSSFSTTTRLGVITVPSDATLKYSPGMWIRIAQSTGGTKYGYITAVTSTTITANFFNLYTLNNEAINTPVYSPLAQPYGAPGLPYAYTDANGWGVLDHGKFKQYNKAIAISGSTSPSSRIAWTSPLPVGATTSSFAVVDTYRGQFSGHMVTSQEAMASPINGNITSAYSGGALVAGGNILLMGRDIF